MAVPRAEVPHLNNDRNTVLEGIAAGILFALLMQFRPFRWVVYALLLWAGFLWAQDWWSEHRLPEDTPVLAWSLERGEQQPAFSERTLTYHVGLRVQNRGEEMLQSATLLGTLYECASPDDPIDACTPVDRSRSHLALDLPPGFVHRLTVYPAFSHAGGPNSRASWRLIEIVADRDAA